MVGAAIRKYWWAVMVVLISMVTALIVMVYLLIHQRFPIPWQDSYNVKVEIRSAQSVTPGQGQEVLVSGVPVGQISDVKVENGRALITLRIKKDELPRVYRNATAALRARTGLQDMTLSLDPGRPSNPNDPKSGELPAGSMIRSADTIPQTQVDEALAALDGDTQAYFKQFLKSTAQTFDGNAEQLQELLRLGAPTLQETHEVLRVIKQRNASVKRSVSSMQKLSRTAAKYDKSVGEVIDRSAQNLSTLAKRDNELKTILAELPGTLELADSTVRETGKFADELRKTSDVARPAIQAANDVLPKSKALASDVNKYLPPFRKVLKVAPDSVSSLLRTSRYVVPSLPGIKKTINSFQALANILGYNPPGKDEGYSFYVPRFAHNLNSLFSQQDANGATWRSQIMLACGDLSAVKGLKPFQEIIDAYGFCK